MAPSASRWSKCSRFRSVGESRHGWLHDFREGVEATIDWYLNNRVGGNRYWSAREDIKQRLLLRGVLTRHADTSCGWIATLPANNASYTAIVRGVNDTTGIAIVEVYALQ